MSNKTSSPEIAALLQEDRRFPPTETWRLSANAADPEIYRRAAADPEAFWAGFAAELEWSRTWDRVLEGPLANGATVLMYEGAPDWPAKDRFWQIVERHGVTILYTAPTARRERRRHRAGRGRRGRMVVDEGSAGGRGENGRGRSANPRRGPLVDHPKVAEAAVVGRPHEIKGQAVVAFVTVKEGVKATPGLADELKEHVAKKIGAIARPDEILFAADLPKTRSGKIMRRLLRDIAEGKTLGDTTTLADPTVVAKLKSEYEDREG